MRSVLGADRVARLVVGIERKWTERGHGHHQLIEVNGAPGLLTWRDGKPDSVTSLEIREGRIAGIYVVRNPDKLGFLPKLVGQLQSS